MNAILQPFYYFTGFSQEAYERLPEDARPPLMGDTTAVCLYKGSELQAMSVMDSWTKNSVRMHVTVFNPLALRHGFHEEAFDFVFNQSGRGVAIGVTPGNNQKALKFVRHLGFQPVYRVKDGCEVGEDLVISEMRKENCRWLKESTHG